MHELLQKGVYYKQILAVMEGSLNFLSDGIEFDSENLFDTIQNSRDGGMRIYFF